MVRPAFITFSCALALAACSPEQRTPSVPQSRPIISAKGRVTRIDATNTPEVVPLAPERVVKAGPFLPVGEGTGDALAHMRSYTTDDGLPMDDIMCAYMDGDGMLWFGTNGGGLARYDGHAFINFTMAHGLPDNVIMSIGGDREGNLWIGTSTGGLCRYDGHRFTTFDIAGATGLDKGIMCVLQGRNRDMWYGSRGHGVFHHHDGEFDVLPVIHPQGKDIVRDMAIANDGALWVATFTGLARYNGRSFERVTAEGDSLGDVLSMVAEADGSIWLGRRGGVTRCAYDGSGVHVTAFPLIPKEQVSINQLIGDGDHGFWAVTSAHGAIRFKRDGAGIPVSRVTAAQGLGMNELMCAVRDQRGDIWFGTRGAGIAHHRGDAFKYYRSIKPISMAEDPQGTLWVGTAEGIARFDGMRFHHQTEGFGDHGWTYSVSIDPQGRMGFGRNMAETAKHGISWFDGRDYHVTAAPDDRTWSDIFWTMHDRRGRLWAGGRRGAELYTNRLRTTFTTAQGLGSDLVLCVVEGRDGAIWVGSDGGGLSRIDSASITTWTTANGLPNNVVWSITEDVGGTLWITTLSGLCRFDGQSFLVYTTKDGLPHDNVTSVAVAKESDGIADRTPRPADDILIGTLDGMAIITGWKDARGGTRSCGEMVGEPNDTVARYDPVIEVYNTSTGFPVKDVQTAENALFEDNHGVIWIATGSDKTGLVRFDRKALNTDTVPINVRLLSVSLNNESTCWYTLDRTADSITVAQQESMVLGGTRTPEERTRMRERYAGVSFSGIGSHFPLPENLVIDHRNNRVGFAFVGIETARPEAVVYQWMLEGYDDDWSKPSRENTASFGNIHEGNYTFKVRAKGPNGVWSDESRYCFSVLPPMHRTWWAFCLYAITVVGAITLIIRRRTAALHDQKQKLERTVAERTVELLQKKDEADEQRKRAEFSEKAKEQFLANMSHEIRTPMNAIMGMSDILKNRPHPPEQDKFLNAIAQSSENLLVIINDILDLSKIDADRIDFESVPFEPRAVLGNVRDVLQFKAEEKGLALVLDFAPDVPHRLIGDPTRLNQIVMNLGGNAIKFTEQGSVTIRASCTVDPLGRRDSCQLIIDVIDTGIGIPEDRHEGIFEEFTQAYSDTTRKYGGTGLGLTISRRLAQRQGGSVTVRSERGTGSTFTVCIPYPVGAA
ncbi:MAG: hypothetical protein KA791_07215 [Flavobacteriales bacterium]|nr:hypothetical protein [Flavobacteriales bacterium]